MQEFRDTELIKTKILEEEKVPQMQEDSTHQVVGKIPKRGETVIINGLQFEVTSSDFIKGRIMAKIRKP